LSLEIVAKTADRRPVQRPGGSVATSNEIEKKTPPSHRETGGPSRARTRAERLVDAIMAGNALDPAGPEGGQSTSFGLVALAIRHASDHLWPTRRRLTSISRRHSEFRASLETGTLSSRQP
jgi:hypothetical protein